jgi:hypothetical protein
MTAAVNPELNAAIGQAAAHSIREIAPKGSGSPVGTHSDLKNTFSNSAELTGRGRREIEMP